MPYQLPERSRATALRAARAMFPHDALPDEAYEKVVEQLEADASGDSGIAATLEQGVAGLDAQQRFASSTPTRSSRRWARARGPTSSSCSRPPRSSSSTTTRYVWKAFGYEGPSTHLGGYVDRGFDDLDWLPDPPTALDPTAGSHHR